MICTVYESKIYCAHFQRMDDKTIFDIVTLQTQLLCFNSLFLLPSLSLLALSLTHFRSANERQKISCTRNTKYWYKRKTHIKRQTAKDQFVQLSKLNAHGLFTILIVYRE